jgi:ligand-binding sensor domain-containing protein/signal transduction histidine kinase
MVALVASAAFAFGQSAKPPTILPVEQGADLQFAHLALGADPSHRRITHIVQDDLGFLWFGTDDGLKRYDGYRIRDYRHDPKDPNSLADSYVITLFKDRSGKLWVASGRYVDVYDPLTEKFTPLRTRPGNPNRFHARVGEINQDRDGTIWLATDEGLYAVDPASGDVFHYEYDAADPASLSSNIVRSTVECKDGTFWVATTAGLNSIDRKSHKVSRRIAVQLSGSVWVTLVEDHKGVLWLAYAGSPGGGLAKVDRTSNVLTYFRVVPERDSDVTSIYEDADGQLWIATTLGGLFKLDPSRTRFIRYRNDSSNPATIASDSLTALFEDREGGVWVGTRGDGIDRFTRKPPPFRRFVHETGNPDSLEKDAVNAVFKDSRGVLWIGCIRSLVKVDARTGKFEFIRSRGGPGELSAVWITSIAEDRSGGLWFGTEGNGLNRLDVKTGRFRVYQHDKNNSASLSNDSVMSLYVDHAGVLWAGTQDGLNAYDPATDSFQVYPPPVKPSTYRWISEDARGNLWLSTAWNGVHRFDPMSKQFTVYRHSDTAGTLSSDAVNTIAVDHAGIVWAGTQAGLNRLDPATGTVTVYNLGLPITSIDSILEDSGGALWLGTGDGLVRFDRRINSFRHFYTSDGLAANELRFSAAWKSPQGEMYFGSYGGLTVFDPMQIAEDIYVPPVRLTGIQILGRPVPVGSNSQLRQSISVANSLVLDHAQNNVSFEFSTLSFASPARNVYRYKLEPLEKEWNEVDSSRRSVTYTGLPPGKYALRVLGSNSRGVWNETGVRLAISVLPPWWNSWWFKTALAGLFLLALWVAYQLRVRQLHHQFEMTLEARVDERTRIARELHDTLLQNFQGLLPRFQAAIYQLPQGAVDARKTLETAVDQAADAITEGRDAVQGLRLSAVERNDLGVAIRTIGEELAATADKPTPAFRVDVIGTPRTLYSISRDEIYRIAAEALRNAFRHARAHRIEVEIRYGDKGFELHVRDDGKGMDRELVSGKGREGHFGLNGMRERAKLVGGNVAVWSNVGAGTEVELSIPSSKAYTRSSRRFWFVKKLSKKKDVEEKIES